MSITAYTSVHHLSLIWDRPFQSIAPHPTTWRSMFMLSSHLRLGLPSGSFLQVSAPRPCMHHSSPPIRATCPAHIILLDLITRISGEQRPLSSSLCSFLHSPVHSTFLGPNILLSNLFPNTLSLRSSLNVCDHVSYPYKTTGNIIVLHILIFTFLDSRLEDRDSAPNDSKHSLTSIRS